MFMLRLVQLFLVCTSLLAWKAVLVYHECEEASLSEKSPETGGSDKKHCQNIYFFKNKQNNALHEEKIAISYV
jgi:hypothetical protein